MTMTTSMLSTMRNVGVRVPPAAGKPSQNEREYSSPSLEAI